jgi:hypothetical protein
MQYPSFCLSVLLPYLLLYFLNSREPNEFKNSSMCINEVVLLKSSIITFDNAPAAVRQANDKVMISTFPRQKERSNDNILYCLPHRLLYWRLTHQKPSIIVTRNQSGKSITTTTRSRIASDFAFFPYWLFVTWNLTSGRHGVSTDHSSAYVWDHIDVLHGMRPTKKELGTGAGSLIFCDASNQGIFCIRQQ